ncbi:MAG: hypothetical protein ABWJ42_04310 [Sulfolobales archaeon]
MRKIVVIATLFSLLLLLSLMSVTVSSEESYYSELDYNMSAVIRDLEYLYSRYVDVDPLIRDLNRAISAYESDNYSDYTMILRSVENNISILKSSAERIYFEHMIRVYGIVIGIGLVPLLIYTLLPRAYLYLWYRYRRKWVVRSRK